MSTRDRKITSPSHRVRRVVFWLLLLAHGSASAAPPSWRLDGSDLIVQTQAGSARHDLGVKPTRLALAEAPLAAGGPPSALWAWELGPERPRMGQSTTRRAWLLLVAGNRLQRLWQGEIGSANPGLTSSQSQLRLLDLDGDGRYELVVWPSSSDDTGHRQGPRQVWRAGPDGVFVRAPRLRAPARPYLTLHATAPEALAVAKVLGQPTVAPWAVIDLHGPRVRPASTLALDSALAVGNEVLYLVHAKGRLHLAVIHAFAPGPTVLARREVGAFVPGSPLPSGCRLEMASRAQLRVAAWDRAGRDRAILFGRWSDPRTFTLELLRWDGQRLHAPAAPATIVERCGGRAEDLLVEPGATGAPALKRIPVPAGRADAW